MAVLGKDDFFKALHEKVGTDSSEESLTFLENMTDTYNDLENRANGDGVDWKKKYEENDKAWQDRYRHRFFNSDGGNPSSNDPDPNANGYDPTEITIDDLFKK